ncbi:Precursor of CEP3 [Camellia lanceoleosa]|uniref:Precursor of CEP3 n=1 Tax=Camellia lanceoleosa TaxID=1840588 RepID=A0ACC0J4C9_9ERIC|nr:Precursor of CEP3 [Camellia lanceoleosa]
MTSEISTANALELLRQSKINFFYVQIMSSIHLFYSAFASILLVLSLFQCIHSSEGRSLKLLRKNEFPKLTSHSINFEKETKEIVDQNSYLHGESTNSTTYMNESVLLAPPPPIAPSQVVDQPHSPPPGHVDDFRPTAPGHSPGVGHSLQN